MPYYRIKETSNISKNIRKVEDLMNKLGLTIQVRVNDQVYFTDKNGNEIEYWDLEQNPRSFDTQSYFPSQFETKLIIEKDEE